MIIIWNNDPPPCVLCGQSLPHDMDCPNPHEEPQRPATWAYWQYLERQEDGSQPRYSFLRWVWYRVTYWRDL